MKPSSPFRVLARRVLPATWRHRLRSWFQRGWPTSQPTPALTPDASEATKDLDDPAPPVPTEKDIVEALARAQSALAIGDHEAVRHRSRTELTAVAVELRRLSADLPQTDIRVEWSRSRIASAREDWREAAKAGQVALQALDAAQAPLLEPSLRDDVLAHLALALQHLGEHEEAALLSRQLGGRGAATR